MIFRVLADDIKSYNTKRKSYVIDYPLLQKGFLHEASFMLGKIILETMGSGILKGEEVVQEDYGHLEQESIKEKCNKGKKRVHKSDTPELKQESAKERKLVEKKCRVLKEEMDIEKPEVLETLSPEEDIFSVLGPVEKKHKSGINSQSKRKMEKERQCISPDKTMKQQIKTVKKNNLNQKETLNLETILEGISENIPEDRQLRYTANGRLSSLFSGEKIQKRKEAADKGEKSSRPQLSSLFK